MLENRARPAQDCLASPLLDLMRTSNVNKIPLEQIEDALSVLCLRKALLAAPGGETDADDRQRRRSSSAASSNVILPAVPAIMVRSSAPRSTTRRTSPAKAGTPS